MTMPRWTIAAVGAASALATWLAHGTAVAALPWTVAIAVAAFGYGLAIERVAGVRVSTALTAVTGLAAWLSIATVLARLGLLVVPVQVGLAGVGIASTLLARSLPLAASSAPRPRTRVAVPLAVAGAALVLAIAWLRLDPAFSDGTNHMFVVKRLLDLGQLAAIPHQLGLELVGDGLSALASGAEAIGGFDAWCMALVVWLVASELTARDAATAELLIATVVVVSVLRMVTPYEGSATVFQLGAILALRPALAEQRVAVHAMVNALALALLRDELMFLAIAYLVASLAIRGRTRTAFAAWSIAVLAIQIAIGIPVGVALLKTVMMLGALPLALLVLRLLATAELASALGIACVAIMSMTLALAVYAVRPAQHLGAVTVASWLGFGLALLIGCGQIRTGAGALALALVAMMAIAPMFTAIENKRFAAHLSDAILALRERRAFGDPDDAQQDVHAAQLRVPRAARIAFWGRSAAELDFRRNAIRDVSRLDDPAPLDSRTIAAADYLIVEQLMSKPRREPWLDRGELVPAAVLTGIIDRLEPVTRIGNARLYRIEAAR